MNNFISKVLLPRNIFKKTGGFTFHVEIKLTNILTIKQQLTANCTVEAENKFLAKLDKQGKCHILYEMEASKRTWKSSAVLTFFLRVTCFYSA